MRKIGVLLVLGLFVVGCEPVEYEVQDNQIRVSGVSSKEIQNIVNEMYDRHGWVGKSVSHFSKFTQINRKKTSETTVTMSAVTEEGKPFSVEILEKTGQPVVVTIHSDPESQYTTQSVVQLLLGEINAVGFATTAPSYPGIRISDLARTAEGASFKGSWIAEGNWDSRVQIINFRIDKDGKSMIQYALGPDAIAEFKEREAGTLPLDFTVSRPGGKMVFTGNREAVSDAAVRGGTVVLEMDMAYLGRIGACVKESITDAQCIELFFQSLEADYAEQVVKAMGQKQALSDLLRLRNYQIESSMIEKVYAAGYRLGVDELIRVQNYQLSPEFMAGFKTAGYDFNLDELIRIKNYQLDAKTFKDAGYHFSIDDQIRAKNYQIAPSFAAKLKEMGCNYSLDELIKVKNYQMTAEYIGGFKKLGCDYKVDDLVRLKNYQITPEYVGGFKKLGCDYTIDELIRLKNHQILPDYIEAFQKIGTPLSIDNLIKARNYQVKPEDLKKYADAGYTFTLDEVIKLRNYSVPMEFIVGVHQDGYKNFTADELIAFRQKNISAAEIRKIRSGKEAGGKE
ncbi:MAG TPA: hypothetical protein PKB02_16445 [Anaerohalosphaeraceae bacterium]|nr:hypothetical protein [Anaerohalosphaeraceae bacterium]